MGRRGTTICCSAFALWAVAAPVSAADRVDQPHLFPVETAWTLPLKNLASAPPAYDGDRAYYPLDGSRIVAYDLRRGIRLWIAPFGTSMQPAAGEGLVFLATRESLLALRAEDGSLAWQLPFADPLSVRPVWDTGWLVLATTAGSVLALRGSDGHLLWRHDLGSAAHAAPAFAGRRVFVPTEDGRLAALSIEDGRPLWEHRLGGAASEILALDSRLYVGSEDNFFYCLATKDGRENWRWRTGADVIGPPVVDERAVYFVSLDNVLRALSRKSGVQYLEDAASRASDIRPDQGGRHAARHWPHRDALCLRHGRRQGGRQRPADGRTERPSSPPPPDRCRGPARRRGDAGPHVG